MQCKALCGKAAILVQDDLKAFNALIDESKCIECGLCHRSCPQNAVPKKIKPVKWHQGWASQNEIRRESSSGGLATAIALSFVREGGVCVSCSFSDGVFGFRKAETEADVLHFRGSKYVKSNPENVYEMIRTEIRNKRKVLFLGLPCQVAGVRNYPGLDSDLLYTVDLICHGSPSPKVLEMFLKESKRDISSVDRIQFRNKNIFRISINGQTITRSGNRDLYMRLFLKQVTYTENCYACKYSTQERCSDLTLGDSWGSRLPEEEIKKGISLILCQTEKGISLLQNADVHLEEVDLQKAVDANKNLSHPSEKPEERAAFFDSLGATSSFSKAFKAIYPQFYRKYEIKEFVSFGKHSND